MSEFNWTTGHVSRLPVHNGDGYSWGGDVIITFKERSINLGNQFDRETLSLAILLAEAPNLLKALKGLSAPFDGLSDEELARRIDMTAYRQLIEAREAIANATGGKL